VCWTLNPAKRHELNRVLRMIFILHSAVSHCLEKK